MSKTLVIDTATERGIVAIIENGNILFEAQLPVGLQNSSYLLPRLHEGLQTLNITPSQLSLIAVGIGPGSYTGIRIGATVAKTLAFASSVPLIGICTLEGFVSSENGCFAVVIDAKVGGAYVQKRERTEQGVVNLSPPQVLPLKEAALLLQDTPAIITPKIGSLPQKLKEVAPQCNWKWQESYPSPQHISLLAQERFEQGSSVNQEDLELLYMRKTQAEIERLYTDNFKN